MPATTTSVSPTAHLVAELEQESAATRKLLGRVPAAKLGWRPHAKSMTLGQLALHVATTPAQVAGMLGPDTLDATKVDFTAPQPGTLAEIHKAFDESLAGARKSLAAFGAKDLATTWRLLAGDKELMAAPKGALLRSLALNHLYHHRGQLTVYLRLLDVPLPSVYGPSADEKAFG